MVKNWIPGEHLVAPGLLYEANQRAPGGNQMFKCP